MQDSVFRYHVKREMLDEVIKPVVRLGEIFGKDKNANKKKMGEINRNREQQKKVVRVNVLRKRKKM